MKLKKYIWSIVLLCSIPFGVFSTHIVGGTLYYVYNGGSSYTITLKLYRDCGSGTAAYPNSVTIAVLGNNGATFTPSKDFTMNLGPVTTIPTSLPPCSAPPNNSFRPCRRAASAPHRPRLTHRPSRRYDRRSTGVNMSGIVAC